MKQVLLLLCEGTEIYEAAAFIDVLGWSGTNGTENVRVVTTGLRKEIHCTFGLRIAAETVVSGIRVEEYDGLAIPGGFEKYGYYNDAYSEEVEELIQRFVELKKPIATICVGALPVAKAGVLNGCRGTTYHLMEGKRRRQLSEFGVQVVDAPIVHSNNIITSTSPATAVEVALKLLAELTTLKNANHIRYQMGFSDAP